MNMFWKFISCKVQIHDVKENSPVFFKNDGNRFQYPCTLKLIKNSNFQFTIHYKPLNRAPIKKVEVDGRKVPFSTFSSSCDQLSIVTFFWNCPEMNASKKSTRSLIKVEISFEDLYYLEFDLQVKYYSSENCKHLTWGRKLNYILVDSRSGKLDLFRLSPYNIFAH